MKSLIVIFYISFLIYPAEAVTTKMFKVLDTCARYRLGEIDAGEAKVKLKLNNSSTYKPKDLVRKYCWNDCFCRALCEVSSAKDCRLFVALPPPPPL